MAGAILTIFAVALMGAVIVGALLWAIVNASSPLRRSLPRKPRVITPADEWHMTVSEWVRDFNATNRRTVR